ncbi:MAG: hypothetical protein FWC75_04410 [Oscillospiraceae bacterium]|nr:hypothetical protein [Oscillospiraceae bacterium]
MKLRHYLSLGLAALILIGSFFLPNAVANISDSRQFDHLMLADSQRISFDMPPDLTLLERIALAGSSNTETLPLSTGNEMDNETAAQVAMREAIRFFSGGAFEFVYDELTVSEGLASLIIDILTPARYMIVWQFDVVDSLGNSVTVVIDEETEMIVRLIYRMNNRYGMLLNLAADTSVDESFSPIELRRTAVSPDELFFSATSRLSEMMTEYFGYNVILADYQFSGSLSYYRADISYGGRIVSMYGVVRQASFSLNERV